MIVGGSFSGSSFANDTVFTMLLLLHPLPPATFAHGERDTSSWRRGCIGLCGVGSKSQRACVCTREAVFRINLPRGIDLLKVGNIC